MSPYLDPARFVENAEAITRRFGRWPSFHDAEVRSIELRCDGPEAPVMETTLHHATMTDEVDPGGFYVLQNQSLTRLRFLSVDELQLRAFFSQNVLCDLELVVTDDPKRPYAVELPSAVGCEASFRCSRIIVVSSEPTRP